jgi:hypothetical protein
MPMTWPIERIESAIRAMHLMRAGDGDLAENFFVP